MKLLQVDFEYQEAMGIEMSPTIVDLAESINEEDGLIWKIWTESKSRDLGGGIYLFEDERSAASYFEMHRNRLKNMGAINVRGLVLDVNLPLTFINHGPVSQLENSYEQ